jgi:D-glycero-D-manno-heptose 1,7-bisphosphate phosphatase
MVDGPEGPDCPRAVDEFKLLPGAAAAVRRLNELGLPIVVVSNQPGVAKGKFPLANLEAMTERMEEALRDDRAGLQGIYYCMHHPDAIVAGYRQLCDCRKPKPGLLVQAAKDLNLDLAGSYMVGDQPRDVIAGKSVGCTTFLIGPRRSGATPSEADHICTNLGAAAELIAQLETATLPALEPTPSPRRGEGRGEGREDPIYSGGITPRIFWETGKATPFIH